MTTAQELPLPEPEELFADSPNPQPYSRDQMRLWGDERAAGALKDAVEAMRQAIYRGELPGACAAAADWLERRA